jgi:hypothetical protein
MEEGASKLGLISFAIKLGRLHYATDIAGVKLSYQAAPRRLVEDFNASRIFIAVPFRCVQCWVK